MSEDVGAVVDETPEPDVVERPARRRGEVYRLCLACGVNVLRTNFRPGASECVPCEQRSKAVPPLVPEAETTSGGADDLGSASVPEGRAYGSPAAPGVDGEGQPLVTIAGSEATASRLSRLCGASPEWPLTLEVVEAHLQALLSERAAMIGRVTRQGVQRAEVRPEDIPLEVAAQALYLGCDPVLQEALTVTMELLGLALHQVILGNLAFESQHNSLMNQDQSLVPQASMAVQFGTGRRVVPSMSAAGLVALPGGRLVDAQGQLVRTCQCCGREFRPTRERPNQAFCDDACGTFADQLRIWAFNAVKYPDMAGDGQPEPETFLPRERRVEPYLSQALQFRETWLVDKREAAMEQLAKMRGL